MKRRPAAIVDAHHGRTVTVTGVLIGSLTSAHMKHADLTIRVDADEEVEIHPAK